MPAREVDDRGQPNYSHRALVRRENTRSQTLFQGLATAILLPIGLALLLMMTPFILVASQCASRLQKDQTAAEECLATIQAQM